MKLRTWLLSSVGVITVAIILTLIVLAESIFPPWAPYFVIYAILAIVIPLVLRSYQFGPFLAVFKAHWRLILSVFVIALVWGQGISTWLYNYVLESLGVADNPFYSLDKALKLLADMAAQKFGMTSDQAMVIYALFVLIWAPVGEELFYRGYIHPTFRTILGQDSIFGHAAPISAGCAYVIR